MVPPNLRAVHTATYIDLDPVELTMVLLAKMPSKSDLVSAPVPCDLMVVES